MDDRPTSHDEPATGERDEVLEVSVGPDRRHRRLDVVDPHAVVAKHLVVLVELRLQAAEVGVACGG